MIPYVQPLLYWSSLVLLLPRPIFLFINTAAIVSIAIRVLKQLGEVGD